MLDYFVQTHNNEPTHTWTLEAHDPGACTIEDLAVLLADAVVRRQCHLCQHHYQAWRAAAASGIPPSPPSDAALAAFIRPIFGLPADPKPTDHVEGYVAQVLWYFLRLDEAPNDNVLRVDMPGYSPTDPGGDALVIHRQDENTLLFRLWEIKKTSGTSTVSSTVRTAYAQLGSSATEYLARYVVIGQEQADPELSRFYGQLLDLWIDASPQAAAGVSVAVSQHRIPKRCFTTFGSRFPNLAHPVRLRGILTAISDFPLFAAGVRDAVWKGL